MGSCMSSPSTKESNPGNSKKNSSSKNLIKVPSVPFLFSVSSKQGASENILGQPFEDVEDSFYLGKELGRGLFGVTRTATEITTQKEYACKSINKRRLTKANLSTVLVETKILAHLKGHPNIAEVLKFFEDDNYVHIVMELCRGGMLYDSITAQGQYSEQQAASMLRAIVRVVAHLHSKGVMHRDLKLENFLLSSKDPKEAELKAIDFGLSTFFTPGQRFSEIVGSAYYVAPEVLKKDYSQECDVWSTGVILYMLLCGVPPFWDVSEVGICNAVLRGDFDLSSDPWPSISTEAKELITRMLELDPRKRITTQEILEHEWVREGGCASSNPINTPIYKRVKQFITMHQMKRQAMAVIADCCLEPHELEIIQSKFSFLDADGDGKVSVDDLISGLRRMSVPVPEADVRAMFAAADVDHNGVLDFSEYASAIMVKQMDPARIRKAFEFFDKDGNGYITVENLKSALSMSSVGDIERILHEVDINKDGKIDFSEFERMMKDGLDTGLFNGGPGNSKLSESRLGELYKCTHQTGSVPVTAAA